MNNFKIESSLVDMKGQEIQKVVEAMVYFYDDHFTARHNFKAKFPKDSEDVSLGWKERHIFEEISATKESVTSVELFYTDATEDGDPEHWAVLVSISGSTSDFKAYFNSTEMEKAVKFKEAFMRWKFDRVIKPPEFDEFVNYSEVE